MKTIDAENRTLGRVATEAAMALMGKDTPQYVPNIFSGTQVNIINASKMKITEKKKGEKMYKRFTGYPSGLKERTMTQVLDKKGYTEILNIAIKKMLPNNRLRKEALKHLKVTN